jgi:transposase, IS30 family
MKKYQHLNQFDRDRIQALLDSGTKQIEIARIIGVHKGTISREVANRRRMDGCYKANTAEHKARVNRGNSKYQGMKIERNPELKRTIVQELKAGRSPDEIAGRMSREKITPRVNKDAIYKWLYSVYGERYCKYLCTRRKKPRKHKEKQAKEMIPNRIGLEWRPEEGIHAEGDTFLSPKKVLSKQAMVLIGIPKEKILSSVKIPDLKPASMKEAVERIGTKISFDDLTLDNGMENRWHELFGVPSYFCDAYSPWQKPFIECSIGLLRRWFIPKGTDLSKITQEELDSYIEIINNKYRKSLGYLSAREAAEESGILKNISNQVALHPRI